MVEWWHLLPWPCGAPVLPHTPFTVPLFPSYYSHTYLLPLHPPPFISFCVFCEKQRDRASECVCAWVCVTGNNWTTIDLSRIKWDHTWSSAAPPPHPHYSSFSSIIPPAFTVYYSKIQIIGETKLPLVWPTLNPSWGYSSPPSAPFF